MTDFLRITPRAAAALKPFMDRGLWLEGRGYLVSDQGFDPPCGFAVSQWRELLAAWRESQVECEGVRLADGTEAGA